MDRDKNRKEYEVSLAWEILIDSRRLINIAANDLSANTQPLSTTCRLLSKRMNEEAII